MMASVHFGLLFHILVAFVHVVFNRLQFALRLYQSSLPLFGALGLLRLGDFALYAFNGLNHLLMLLVHLSHSVLGHFIFMVMSHR